jgi:hypothetical protein
MERRRIENLDYWIGFKFGIFEGLEDYGFWVERFGMKIREILEGMWFN